MIIHGYKNCVKKSGFHSGAARATQHRRTDVSQSGDGVLLLYTGGTIGSLRRDRTDPLSPLEPAPLDEVLSLFSAYDPYGRRIVLGAGAVRIATEAFDPPLDSSDMRPADWLRMARIIERRYAEFEGFVILHGTDTLAYTASALAFMLQNLDKPVVITGSQRPMGEVRSDANQNLITAIEIAAARSLKQGVVPEVTVFFRDRLFRGCRTTKVNAASYDAFDSPNLEPLARAGDRVAIAADRVRRPPDGALQVRDRFEENVASLDFFPGMPPTLLSRLFATEGLRGVVLRTFGNGNIPSDPGLLEVIGDAVDRGIVVLNATQCLAGEVVPGRYRASAGLMARGVAGSLDMTREAALTKLCVILGEETDPEVAADRMQLDLAGEQRRSVYNLRYPGGRIQPGRPVLVPAVRVMTGGAGFDPDRVESAVFRVGELRSEEGAGMFRARFYLVDGEDDRPRPDRLLGEVAKDLSPEGGGEYGFLPIPASLIRILHGSAPPRLLVEPGADSTPCRWRRAVAACLCG